MVERKPNYRVDRAKIEVVALQAPPDNVTYWRPRSPRERLLFMEFLRQINYGEAALAGRLKRVLEVAQREAR
jgi:hypothetical protein